MIENKTATDVRVRQKYEPAEVEFVNVRPQGMLCQSGGVALSSGVESIASVGFSNGSLSAF